MLRTDYFARTNCAHPYVMHTYIYLYVHRFVRRRTERDGDGSAVVAMLSRGRQTGDVEKGDAHFVPL